MKKESIRKLRLGGRLLLGIYLACLIYFMFFSEIFNIYIASLQCF